MLRGYPGRQTQSVFYGSIASLTGVRPTAPRPPTVSPDFLECQKGLFDKDPLWVLHGCFVSDGNHKGALSWGFGFLDLLCCLLFATNDGLPTKRLDRKQATVGPKAYQTHPREHGQDVCRVAGQV